MDPFRLARQQTRMSGAIPVEKLARISGLVREGSGTVEVALRFRMSASGVPRADGHALLKAHLTCQRCLGPLDLELAPALKVAFTDGGEAVDRAELAAGYEPLECSARIGLTTMIEDEILLALPDFPMHPPDVCAPAGESRVPGPEDSPFSGLRVQLQQSRN